MVPGAEILAVSGGGVLLEFEDGLDILDVALVRVLGRAGPPGLGKFVSDILFFVGERSGALHDVPEFMFLRELAIDVEERGLDLEGVARDADQPLDIV